jgi:hypothetical protein
MTKAIMLFDALCSIQKRCDELSFSIHGKRFAELTEQELLSHKCFHLGKAVGKLSTVCEIADHGETPPTALLTEEVIPDLIIYALQLANLYNLNLDEIFVRRMGYVLAKHKNDDAPTASEVALMSDLNRLLTEAFVDRAYDERRTAR